ncbi:MAG: Rpn family recombination-promoting nuclease/putative transposase [Candidatus Competibacterales bacterium]
MADTDHAYKLLFSHRETVIDLLSAFVPGDWVAHLDYATLERVSEVMVGYDLREREDDAIWRVRWGERWLYIYLLLEFQSSIDRWMAVRVMIYVGMLYQELIKAKEITPQDDLPPVLPIVLYNGESPWTAATDLATLIAPGLPAELQRWQPQVHYLLLDQLRCDDDALAGQQNLVAAIFRLEKSRTLEEMERVLAELVTWLTRPEQTALRRAFVVWIKRVLAPARLPNVDVPHVTELAEMHNMLAERVKAWTEAWKQEGLKEGRKEGRKEGLKEGLKEGHRDGEAKILRKLLSHKFGPLPPWVDERLAKASEAELEHWSERLFESQSLGDIFPDTPAS